MLTSNLFSVLLPAAAIIHCSAFSTPAPRNPSHEKAEISRRDIFRTIVSASLVVPLLPLSSAQALDSVVVNDAEMIDVYFGCGCFWHVQHELVEAEKRILKRDDMSLSARTGYAGGLSSAQQVCYHNAKNVGDYGKLGHAEVVALRIPTSSFELFAAEYFKLFDDKGNRPDQNGDRGSEYRSLIGVPGGAKSPYADKIISASQSVGDKLGFAVGKGDDRDTRAVSYIMDTANFPFFMGEQYHQFHDGFNLNENYPKSYNGLAAKLAAEGKLGKESTCPNGTFGIGVLGL
jgi:peptide methionine sulfoxide reductase MsrA